MESISCLIGNACEGCLELGPLAIGITAGVVGVILNLAVVFGLAVLLPAGWGHAPSWFAVSVTAAAFVALFFFKLDEVWVVLAGGALGLLHAVLM